MKLRTYQTTKERRAAIEKLLGIDLPDIGTFSFDEKQAGTKNCENMIGATQVPLGIAGPLKILHATYNIQNCYIPLATTEGALIASVSRGCKIITESGGASVSIQKVGTTRGPVFYTGSLEESKKLYEWLKSHESEIKKVAGQTSKHLSCKKLEISSVADYVFVRFSFDTADAMGMNMVTIATEKITAYIEEQTGIPCLSVAGNFDIDKKPAWLNSISNRGYKAWAEVVIKKELAKDILKTTPERIFDVWLGKCMIGSAMSGSLGFNAQYANIIAALFLATGQDTAHTVEGSMGITTTKVLPSGDLYCSIYLPALMVGTVGGGTQLATQKEALSILRIMGSGQTEKFAAIIAAAVLAGELSLLASLAQGTLGKAHEKLGRGK